MSVSVLGLFASPHDFIFPNLLLIAHLLHDCGNLLRRVGSRNHFAVGDTKLTVVAVRTEADVVSVRRTSEYLFALSHLAPCFVVLFLTKITALVCRP